MSDEEKPKLKKKKQVSTFWGVIIIFAAAVILFGGTYTWCNLNGYTDFFVTDYGINFSSNSNSNSNTNANSNININSATAGWKTYTSSTNKFNVKYPNNWTEKDQQFTASNSGYYFYSGTDKRYDVAGVVQPNVILSVVNSFEEYLINELGSSNALNKNYNSLLSYIEGEFYSTDQELSNHTITTNAGTTAYWVNYKDAATIWMENNNKIYILVLTSSTDFNKCSENEKNIFSTFQFTN